MGLKKMEIISWNILSGGFTDYGSDESFPPRIGEIIDAIKILKPDIISLIDTYRWTEIYSKDELKRMFDYPIVHSVKLEDPRLIEKGHDNGITVFSKIPGSKMETIRLHNRNAILSKINGIDLFSVYLDDLNEAERLNQMKSVMEIVNPETPTVIAGDFNTFDKDDLNETNKNLSELSLKYPGPMQKMEPVLNEMKRGQVTEYLKGKNFRDFGKNKGNTVPAKLFPHTTDKPLIRLDYAFGNTQIKLEEFKVLTEEKYSSLSDHLPIWMKVSLL